MIRRGLRLPLVLVNDGLLRLRVGPDAPRKHQLLFVRPRDVGWNRIGRVGLLGQSPDQFSGVVAGGDWDSLDVVNTERPETYSTTEKRIVGGLSWEEAGEVDRMLSLVAGGGTADFCRSLEDIERRNRKLDAVIDFARSRCTLLSRRELPGFGFREMGGISVAVTRDGRLLLVWEGVHRLSIAQILDVPVIPVAISLVHAECLENGVWASLVARSRRLEKERAALLAGAPGGTAQDAGEVSG